MLCLPKHEPILNQYKLHPDSLINYPWEYWHDYANSKGWNTKYRNNSPYNGDKPEWRNQRKRERRFKELQFKILADNEDEFMDYMIEYNMVTL